MSDAMVSDAASLVAGLEDYGQVVNNSCTEWARSYLCLYYRKLHGKSLKQSFTSFADSSIGEAGVKKFSEAHISEDDEDTDDQNGEGGEHETKANDDSENNETEKAAGEKIEVDIDSAHNIKRENVCV